MNSAFPFRRRENLTISVSILKAARNGVRKTSLIRSVSLSYGQFVRYITLLKACGFVTEDEVLVYTTEKGRELIREFDSSPLIQSVLVA